MLYLTTILISLYYLFFKSIQTCYYIDNYRDDYLFEQSNDDKLNNELENDYFAEYYFNDCSINDDDQYYEGYFDYSYSNEIDKYLTKYFNIN